MSLWRAALIVDRGDTLRCRVTRSTGDAASDAQGCAAMQRCFDDARPRIMAARAPGLAKAARRRLLGMFNRDLNACFLATYRRFATDDRPASTEHPSEISDPAH